MLTLDEACKMIVVRDRREPKQFSVHNNLIDQWFPIIGDRGFVLYAFYTRLANRRDERAFPGYSLICKHFGYSRATIARYNRLLVWCNLIEIVPGNRCRPNNYYILEIPEATAEARARVRRRALAELDKAKRHEARFQALVLSRLDTWQPIQHWWKTRKSGEMATITRAQLEMKLQGAVDNSEGVVYSENQGGSPRKLPQFTQETTPVHPGNQGSFLGELEQSEQNNPNRTIRTEQSTTNNTVADAVHVLVEFGIDPETAQELAEANDLDLVTAWVRYAKGEKNLHSPTGLVVARLRAGVSAPAVSVEPVEKVNPYACFCGEPWLSGYVEACPTCGYCGECCKCN